MINIGGNIDEVYVGSTKIAEAYVGSQLVYRSAPEVLPYDAEIEYLETQGNCQIWTTCIPSGANIAISAKYLFNGFTSTANWQSWYIAYVNDQTQCFRGMRSRTDAELWITNGAIGGASGNDAKYYGIVTGNIYVIETNRRNVTVNGETKTCRAASSVINTNAMRVMTLTFKGKLYYFKILDNGVRILDCIPVRVGNDGYMYDKVSKQLFGNDGTGTLILGNDVT